VKFECGDCNACCISLDYYKKEGSVRLDPETGEEEPLRHYFLGKRGIELLPMEARNLFRESDKFRHLRDEEGKEVLFKFIPSIAIVPRGVRASRRHIRTYQLMGRTSEGDICPFYSLDKHRCLIYDKRPISCRAFPVDELYSDKKVSLSKNCTWVASHILEGTVGLLDPYPVQFIKRLNTGAALRLQKAKYVSPNQKESSTLWIYATGTYNNEDRDKVKKYTGWVEWGWN
jgi:Fe-S-cluster containining protein